ncbi:Crp/Fnr family transcriptional regulator [Cellulomonas aerilata]|uniref:Crp/Fnr family transcriptional regulator n=1 Tax=Cellulomonas aerilata TaxID=515326 RepID=A0A512D9C4_9CELL|nr:Crp/Fnr family transcriptional regulator [Cellulomonas aerilata]GEO33088.1 Crp/Fnr family transcriptional regulator [Cellulomonas aerilata]
MSDILALTSRNAVLGGIAPPDLEVLVAELRHESLELGRVLHEPGRPVDAVYFPLVGVVSLVAEVDEDDVVEVGTVGHEGMVGLSLFFGAESTTERAVVQVAGEALSVSAEGFHRCSQAIDGPLHAALRRFSQSMFTQLARNSACNRVHPVQQRAARWLLMTSDRMLSPSFELTQGFLAQMLAVRRATVNQVARALAEDGCITYVRGFITILDRDRLHSHACSCYDIIRASTSCHVRAA